MVAIPDFNWQDIPIVKLKLLRERPISKREHDRILASILAVGMIEPFVVYPEDDCYVVLDGEQRYHVLVELGVETVPCIMWKDKEAFTSNRMVNRVSPVQEARMIEKSMEEVDAETIGQALGVASIEHRLSRALIKQLHPDVAAAMDQGKITRACAREFTFVTPPRQKEILTAMESYNDFGGAFAKSMIIKTNPKLRSKKQANTITPWNRNTERRSDLLKRLEDVEQKHDFYVMLYRQYSVDLLRLVIYARSLITNARVLAYLEQKHGNAVLLFRQIVADAEN